MVLSVRMDRERLLKRAVWLVVLRRAQSLNRRSNTASWVTDKGVVAMNLAFKRGVADLVMCSVGSFFRRMSISAWMKERMVSLTEGWEG